MRHARGYRGWMAASTVGVTLMLILLAVGRYIQLPNERYFRAPHSTASLGASTTPGPQLMTADPGRAQVTEFPSELQAPLVRREVVALDEPSAGRLRRPPEPSANVVLLAPVTGSQLTSLPLHDSSSDLELLMETMDSALHSPVRAVSARTSIAADLSRHQPSQLTALPSPVTTTARVPLPRRLLDELTHLEFSISPAGRALSHSTPSTLKYIAQGIQATELSSSEFQSISLWINQVRSLIDQIVMQHGLEHPASFQETLQLANLAGQAARMGESLTNYEHATQMIRVAYSLNRRVTVWQAVQACLDPTSISLTRSSSSELTRSALRESLVAVNALLDETGDKNAWRTYLLLERLEAWVESPQNIWSEGNDLALDALSRLRWERLTNVQRQLLSRDEFSHLASHLEAWSRDPVDYRKLLIDLEELETDPLNRDASSLAGAVQVLRTSPEPKQQELAAALNDHYRNANVRLSVSRELIERFLPETEMEVRPIRRKILGADTQGDSTVRTQLGLEFLPDPNGWNIGIGVIGDLYSNTASSKGPATFHNTSTAQISSTRYIRLDPLGYHVSADPTNVNSRDTLKKMSTDFDGLPIIGDFVRLVVREQFDQKRGLAKRISQRIIAQETDQEIDKRLEEGLTRAEQELEQRITGPLHRLQLNPMVVAMQTTAERLAIRYRVASRQQMAAHTPRPRAPSDSLLSMQIHQSTLNNTIDSIGLGGKTWALQDLCHKLGEVFGMGDWKLPEDAPQDISIRFADSRPAYVEIQDGKLRLTLRIAELIRGTNEPIQRIIVTSSYVPLADGLTAELIRDGVVEINASRSTPTRHSVMARFIFAKVFVERPSIALISETWQNDPRAEGLAVSQLELRDNWLSVAISNSNSAHAEEVATRSRLIRQNF